MLEVSYQIDKERVKVKKMRVLYQLFDKALFVFNNYFVPLHANSRKWQCKN